MKKKLDPQAKAKRQKQILIGGGVVLVAVLALQGPGLLKQLRGSGAAQTSSPAAPAAVSPPAPSSGPATPAGTTAPATAADGAARLPADPDPAPLPQEGQLAAFSLLESKDPFVQQLSARDANNTSGAPATSGAPPASSPPASSPAPTPTPPPSSPPSAVPPSATTPPVPPVTPPATTTPSTPPATTTPAPTVTTPPTQSAPTKPAPGASSASISINGVAETVRVGGEFPKASPLFRLVSIKDGVARIGIAGGSLQDGSETVALRKGKTLTLMNTADGTRYVLKLVSIS